MSDYLEFNEKKGLTEYAPTLLISKIVCHHHHHGKCAENIHGVS